MKMQRSSFFEKQEYYLSAETNLLEMKTFKGTRS